jgi:hypothetical protein
MGGVMTSELMKLSSVMKTSRGRDKVCALIQYSANLYVTCMRESIEYGD